jgi:hypothetical protein
MGLWPFAVWDCEFEFRRGRGCLSRVSVVCCQVEVSAMGRSLLQSSPTDRDVPECDLGTSLTRRPRSTRAFEPREKQLKTDLTVQLVGLNK